MSLWKKIGQHCIAYKLVAYNKQHHFISSIARASKGGTLLRIFFTTMCTSSFLTQRLVIAAGLTNFLDRSQYYDQWPSDKVNIADIAAAHGTIVWMSVGMESDSQHIMKVHYFTPKRCHTAVAENSSTVKNVNVWVCLPFITPLTT